MAKLELECYKCGHYHDIKFKTIKGMIKQWNKFMKMLEREGCPNCEANRQWFIIDIK